MARGSLTQQMRSVNRWREQFNPMRGLTIAQVVSLREAFVRGEMADYQWLSFWIEQADADLFAVIERRVSAILEMDWKVKVVSEQRRGKDWDEGLAAEQAAALTEAYNRISNLEDAKEHLTMAVFRGFAHCELVRDGGGEVVELRPVDQWNVVRDGLNGGWKYNPEGAATTFAALSTANLMVPEDFMVRTVKRHVNFYALPKFCRTSLGEKDWTAFIEIYGVPGGVVTMPPNIPQGKESEYEDTAVAVAEGGSGAVPNGSTYTPNDSPRGTDPFSPFLRYFSEKLVLVATGGKLTMLAESGSGTLAGGAHADAFKQLARADGKKLGECFQRMIDVDVLGRNFPSRPRLAYFELCYNQEASAMESADLAVKLGQAGFQLEAEELGEKVGMELSEKAELPTSNIELRTSNGERGSNTTEARGTQSEAGDGMDGTDEGLKNRALVEQRWAEGLGVPVSWLKPIADYLAEMERTAQVRDLNGWDLVNFYKEGLARLPEVFGKMDVEGLARVMEGVMGQAVLRSMEVLAYGDGAGSRE
jgi:phage gp29-like protein